MPHLTLEYTDNLAGLDVKKCLHNLNATLVSTSYFQEADIKSRALRFDDYVIGVNAEARAFAHVKLCILNGRTPEVKRQLSSMLLEKLSDACVARDGLHVQLTVEILEIDRDSYVKNVYPG